MAAAIEASRASAAEDAPPPPRPAPFATRTPSYEERIAAAIEASRTSAAEDEERRSGRDLAARHRRDAAPPPDLRADREAWFTHWDTSGEGLLDKQELKEALVGTFGCEGDLRRCCDIYDAVDALWPIFDLEPDGEISRTEFNEPNTGLADTLLASLRFDS